MTQQYLIGELSSLLGELGSAEEGSLHAAVEALRHDVEAGPLPLLPQLSDEALDLTESICWESLERGRVQAFDRCARIAAALADFAVAAGLRR